MQNTFKVSTYTLIRVQDSPAALSYGTLWPILQYRCGPNLQNNQPLDAKRVFLWNPEKGDVFRSIYNMAMLNPKTHLGMICSFVYYGLNVTVTVS